MQRLFALLLAVLACALLAAPAHGARVKSKAVGQSKAAVERYWTADRMRNARPVPLAPPGDKGPNKPKGPKQPSGGIATQIAPPYTSAPVRTNGKVFFSSGGLNYVCSGTALLSGNKSTVWTAGHCVNEGDGSGFHTNWAFVPAYANGTRPYGTWTAKTLHTSTGWANGGDFSYDVGAAVVNTNGGSSLTDVVGGQGIAFNYSRNQTYEAYGYPAASPFNGGTLWKCTSPVSYNDTGANPATMGIACDMTGGSSGGGWIVGSSVYSVNSYGYSTLKNVMFGPYQGSVAQGVYNQAASG
jgi:V8-like Glu-specific endopeptidase